MAIRSYDSRDAYEVAHNIGLMFEYAIRCKYDYNEYWDQFISSFVAREIENGNPKYVYGFSAIDLLSFVVALDSENSEVFNSQPIISRSKYYWAGWIMSLYQNYKLISFFDLNRYINIERVLCLYDTYHEADVTKFFNYLDAIIEENKKETNLKRIRMAAGLSQQKLAEKAGVSIRNIQMYEQRQNDINKAQVDILSSIANVLGCTISDLLE